MWLIWCHIMIGFPAWVEARLDLQRPDFALFWTAGETAATSNDDQPYLLEPFMNRHVAWDSEFYLSIATVGYDDPAVRSVDLRDPAVRALRPDLDPALVERLDGQLTLNYSFMPFYPWMMRLVAVLLSPLGLNPIASATLAGVLISMLGTYAAMLALYDLAANEFGPDGGVRSAFYLIAFPTALFLAQVYTEGLFIGLAFSSIALARRERWGAASLLASGAVLTRPIGIAVIIPLIWPLLGPLWQRIRGGGQEPSRLFFSFSIDTFLPILVRLVPIATFLIWYFSMHGQAFRLVESLFFGRDLLDLAGSAADLISLAGALSGSNSQAAAYAMLELGGIGIGLVACLATLRRYPAVSIYGLAAVLIPATSGHILASHRFLLAIPSVFIVLGRLGRSPLFDRVWTLFSILLLSVLVTLFTFDFWVG
ncbi:MAG: hypothetical protein AAF633_14640 [Chloroflexota bacterium]